MTMLADAPTTEETHTSATRVVTVERKPSEQPVRFVDADGTLYSARDDAVYVSTNNGDSWDLVHGFGPEFEIVQVMKLKSRCLLAAGRDGQVWLADKDDTEIWTQKLPQPGSEAGKFTPPLGLRAYAREGAAPGDEAADIVVAAPSDSRFAWVSEDSGNNWRILHEWTGDPAYKNLDAVFDPYSNAYWVSGEVPDAPNLRYSTDGGVTWHDASAADKHERQMSQILVFPRYVLFISYDPRVGVLRWDRDPNELGQKDLTFKQVLQVANWPDDTPAPPAVHGAVALGTPYGDLAYFGWMLPAEVIGTGSVPPSLRNARVFSMADGEKELDFSTLTQEPDGAGVTGIYGPDDKGNLWIAVENKDAVTETSFTNARVNVDMWNLSSEQLPVKILARKQARQPVRFVDVDGTLYSGCDNAVHVSRDKGDTWELVHAFSHPGQDISIVQVAKLENGRLVAASTNGMLWVSDPVHHDEWEKKLPLEGEQQAQFNSSFGLRMTGNVIMAAQYDPTFQVARKAFLSDGGETWSEYYFWQGPGTARYHNHDVTLDPHSDLFWLCSGDFPDTQNIRYSPDGGTTWTEAAPQGEVFPQMSQILVMKECVLFVSDNPIVGVWRWDRDGGDLGKPKLKITQALHVENWKAELAVPMASHGTVARDTSFGDLAYFGWFLGPEETGHGSHHGKLINAPVYTTRDGKNFYSFQTLEKEPNGAGVTGVYGPDQDGNLWIAVENTDPVTQEGYTNVMVNIDMWGGAASPGPSGDGSHGKPDTHPDAASPGAGGPTPEPKPGGHAAQPDTAAPPSHQPHATVQPEPLVQPQATTPQPQATTQPKPAAQPKPQAATQPKPQGSAQPGPKPQTPPASKPPATSGGIFSFLGKLLGVFGRR